MSPTRTDTTLQQRRRISNSIPLNNIRSDVHTSKNPGHGGCSTVASRVSNEQRSYNMCRGHNRQQLLTWLMSKEAIASCFIKDVHSMSESEHTGGMRLLAWWFSVYPNSVSDRSSPLLSRSCTLQINLLGRHRGWSYSVRETYCLHT